jgi:hypothetical protein
VRVFSAPWVILMDASCLLMSLKAETENVAKKISLGYLSTSTVPMQGPSCRPSETPVPRGTALEKNPSSTFKLPRNTKTPEAWPLGGTTQSPPPIWGLEPQGQLPTCPSLAPFFTGSC